MRHLRSILLVFVSLLASSSSTLAQSCNTADRSIMLILDASGSMNAKLPNGETRIAVAQPYDDVRRIGAADQPVPASRKRLEMLREFRFARAKEILGRTRRRHLRHRVRAKAVFAVAGGPKTQDCVSRQ